MSGGRAHPGRVNLGLSSSIVNAGAFRLLFFVILTVYDISSHGCTVAAVSPGVTHSHDNIQQKGEGLLDSSVTKENLPPESSPPRPGPTLL